MRLDRFVRLTKELLEGLDALALSGRLLKRALPTIEAPCQVSSRVFRRGCGGCETICYFKAILWNTLKRHGGFSDNYSLIARSERRLILILTTLHPTVLPLHRARVI